MDRAPIIELLNEEEQRLIYSYNAKLASLIMRSTRSDDDRIALACFLSDTILDTVEMCIEAEAEPKRIGE